MPPTIQPRIVTVGSIGANDELEGWAVHGGTIELWPLRDLRTLVDIKMNAGESAAEQVAASFSPPQ